MKKNKSNDLINRSIGSVSEEVENFGRSIRSQLVGDGKEEESPIVEAVQQKIADENGYTGNENELNKKAGLSERRKYIKTREEMDEELKKLKIESEEKLKNWRSSVEEKINIIHPGEKMQKEDSIPLTTKPKRGMVPGMPGTAKGGSGMEVLKRKQ